MFGNYYVSIVSRVRIITKMGNFTICKCHTWCTYRTSDVNTHMDITNTSENSSIVHIWTNFIVFTNVFFTILECP